MTSGLTAATIATGTHDAVPVVSAVAAYWSARDSHTYIALAKPGPRYGHSAVEGRMRGDTEPVVQLFIHGRVEIVWVALGYLPSPASYSLRPRAILFEARSSKSRLSA